VFPVISVISEITEISDVSQGTTGDKIGSAFLVLTLKIRFHCVFANNVTDIIEIIFTTRMGQVEVG
jgi:hypothetical protein